MNLSRSAFLLCVLLVVGTILFAAIQLTGRPGGGARIPRESPAPEEPGRIAAEAPSPAEGVAESITEAPPLPEVPPGSAIQDAPAPAPVPVTVTAQSDSPQPSADPVEDKPGAAETSESGIQFRLSANAVNLPATVSPPASTDPQNTTAPTANGDDAVSLTPVVADNRDAGSGSDSPEPESESPIPGKAGTAETAAPEMPASIAGLISKNSALASQETKILETIDAPPNPPGISSPTTELPAGAPPRERAPALTGGPIDLVEVTSIHPRIQIELPYATADNFCGQVLYPVARCFLRREVAENLAKVQAQLEKKGRGLKIWDGYRPHEVQFKMWEIMPKSGYVGNPTRGSRHNRGAAVDLTMVDLKSGREVGMPTAYDDFSPKAHATYLSLPKEILENRKMLQDAMQAHGFQIMRTEWWHFDAVGWQKFPLANIPIEDLAAMHDALIPPPRPSSPPKKKGFFGGRK